jgi:DNA-directed RNA polymerase
MGIVMNKQLQIELEYSKRMKTDIILKAVLDDVPSTLYNELLWNVKLYKAGNYYASKQKRVDALPFDEEIVNNILTIILSSDSNKPIQSPATELGTVLGFNNPIDAVKTGAELLAVTHGELFDIALSSDGTDIIPKLQLDSKTRAMIDNLQYLPPMQQKPNDWISNTDGGWLWERKSIILGKGNHHDEYQAYDVLNRLQSVAWTIDVPTYVNNENPHCNDKEQFDTVVTDALSQPFYFVWRYDKRGRSYSSGYDLNVQSDEYGKAMISLHNKQSVTKLDNLKIAIANHAGHDKLTWNDRIKWFNRQLEWDMDQFDEPILGTKALGAYYDAKNGCKTGYVMSIDATASGLQIMSALSGCKDTARVCNMINTGTREDVYQMIADKMNVRLNGKYGVTRKMVKKPCMTTFYNSLANPKQTFNKHQLKAFYETLDGLMPGAMEVMEAINEFWDYDNDIHQWTLPDGHVASVKVTEMVDVRVEIDELDHRTFTYRYNKQQPSENFRSLVANIVHSVDGYVAREMVRSCQAMGIELVHIHDCFVFSPDYLQYVAQSYREILAHIADSNLLSDILSEISGEYVPVEKLSDDLYADILDSEYMLS